MYNILFPFLAQITHNTFSVRSMIIHAFMYISREMKNWISFGFLSQQNFRAHFDQRSGVVGNGCYARVRGDRWARRYKTRLPNSRSAQRPALRERSTEENRVASRWLVVPSGCHSDGGMYVDCPLRYPNLPCVRVYMSACVCVRHKNESPNVYMRS